MTTSDPSFNALPCCDSFERGLACLRALSMPTNKAQALGRPAVAAAERGFYVTQAGEEVDWKAQVDTACAGKRSIAPDQSLVLPALSKPWTTRVEVANETTFMAARRLAEDGQRPLALNFANGTRPGGGFLRGALAQEEVLCRSSALYSTLVGDPMYAHHATLPAGESSDWVIYSPDVPVFRTDDGTDLERPWTVSFITAAAPNASVVGQPRSADLLQARIVRVLSVATALGYDVLVLGAWGCGAFGNDPVRTARDFRAALSGSLRGRFSRVVFAITDSSPQRRTLGPFRDAFCG
jgi:uncharacterized protein (TIGR02452 family)